MHDMTTRDMFEAVAAILHPMPNFERFVASNPHLDETDLHLIFSGESERAVEMRERAIAEMRERATLAAEDDQYFDPLLEELAECHAQIVDVEHRMRLLMAYAREYVRPQPYQLKDLARATGMSISGVRIAYDEDEIREVGERTGDKPRRPLPVDES
jgi:hypothetical protein